MKRNTRRASFALALIVILGAGCGGWLERSTRIDPAEFPRRSCLIVTDRHGNWLRFIPDEPGTRHLRVPLSEIPQRVQDAFIAAEDRNFRRHLGIDPGALARAAWDSVRAGRIVSGASTITQQVVRLIRPTKRGIGAKMREMIGALRLENQLSKDDILELYLNRVPLGNQLEGVEAAARTYFGKPCSALDAAEAAILAALPKAPGRLNPYGADSDRLLRRKDWVLGRMHATGRLTAAALDRERHRPIVFQPRRFPFEAPHFVDFVVAAEQEAESRSNSAATDQDRDRTLVTSLDLDLERRVERVLEAHRARLERHGARQAAAVVLDNADGSILALAGSIHYGPGHLGYNNGALALRSPGSALKPFLYAQALDAGFTAASLLDDLDREYRFPGGSYLPANYDRRTYGPVTLREALANSFNLSAVYLLNRIGPQAFYEVLNRLDLINFPERGADHYGLGLVVGNPEVTLLQLAAAYACFANGGSFRPPTWRAGAQPASGVQVFSEQAAFLVADILADPSARALAFARAPSMNPPYRVAMKTGTSSRYRDGWIAAFTPAHTVAVWVGNFDGRPTAGLSGSAGAAPVLAEILDHLYRLGPPPTLQPPPGLIRTSVCPVSGLKPGPLCPQWKEEWFMSGSEPKGSCTMHRQNPLHHELPARFATWVEQRRRQGTSGRYRLAGADPIRASADSPTAGPVRASNGGPSEGALPAAAHDDAGASDSPENPARLGGAPAPATRPFVPLAPPVDGSRRDPIQIIRPSPGSRIVLDRRRTGQSLVLEAAVATLQPQITWTVDDSDPVAVAPPYVLEWPMGPGRHVIFAETPDHHGDRVEIIVE